MCGPIAPTTRVALPFEGDLLALVQPVEGCALHRRRVEKELGPLVVDDEPEAAIGDQAPDFSCARQIDSFMLPTDVGHSTRHGV
jgi:hypothetical protein